MANLTIHGDHTNEQIKTIQHYLDTLPAEDVLAGLKFAEKRWAAKSAGTLRVGRRGIVSMEVDMVTVEQARWRLDNWKKMIASYRRRGYSYPTISRIKKKLADIADQQVKKSTRSRRSVKTL